MPRRTDLKRILIIGSGPIVIGQAGEFDYSGTQAVRALKEEGYDVSLVNSNPATIMTDPELSDATYMVPLTVEAVERVLEKDRPDAILPTMGGQTALNLSVALSDAGVLSRLGIELIGTSVETIRKAEDRGLFKKAMESIGLASPKSFIVHSLEDARQVLLEFNFPIMIRPSFTLGGSGGGVVYNREEFEQRLLVGLEMSPVHEVLVEESLLGWKEFELEVVRDRVDNAIIVCSIENLDPMGVHTGDSITVAPAMTLTDREFQYLRNASIAILREVGVETGGSNVQFAVHPETGRVVVIEMNPRVSRSSALASKATGFPIARVATKVAIGYTLDEIQNDITGTTPASFEPSIDYVVVKVPRFHFEKFPQASRVLGPQMQSVGEVMGIGHNFKEAFLKALRSLENNSYGLMPIALPEDPEDVAQILRSPIDTRIHAIAEAFRRGFSLDKLHEWTGVDPWFLREIRELIQIEHSIAQYKGEPLAIFPEPLLVSAKRNGFSDRALSHLLGQEEDSIREMRLRRGLILHYRHVDTCAAEFEAQTPYLYGTYGGKDEGGTKNGARQSVVILGSGPNRIGQGVEFDYCCVHGVMALRESGFEAVMVNCNPETVSTDFDLSDRLYFDPLTMEDVLAILEREKPMGVVVQFGGQTPLRLSRKLMELGIPILGTQPDMTDLAEDRERFRTVIQDLGLKQPASALAHSIDEAGVLAKTIGYPLLIRPSYVLGGEAMEILYDDDGLTEYLKRIFSLDFRFPLLIDSFIGQATEVDVDALCDGQDVFVAGILEHIEEAGIHSGDSACFLPPLNLSPSTLSRIREETCRLGLFMGVRGLMNIQFAVQNETVYVLEVNPRASRTVPFVSKSIGIPLAKMAMRILLGETIADLGLLGSSTGHPYVSVKEAVFPFRKFQGVDTLLGPEMKSTGEVMGIGKEFGKAFLDAQEAAGMILPRSGTVFISVSDHDKPAIIPVARSLSALGFRLVATHGTRLFLEGQGITVEEVLKVKEGRPHVVDQIKNGEIQLVINTVSGRAAQKDSLSIRRETLTRNIPYYTTVAGAKAVSSALSAEISGNEPAPVLSLQEIFRKTSTILP
ncbi:MAG: carbamoyl-phosphate synthase large subunit [Leptospirales bacterium]